MWKKPELDQTIPATKPVTKPAPPEPRMAASTPLDGATIGPSISIRGEVTGEEDLVIRGRVDGTVNLKEHNVTIGKEGRVRADVHARIIQVEGHLEGDVYGKEQVVMRGTGDVKGNVSAPRVSLEEGCRFKGSIDMESPVESKTPKTSTKVSGIAEAGALHKRNKSETEKKPEQHAS